MHTSVPLRAPRCIDPSPALHASLGGRPSSCLLCMHPPVLDTRHKFTKAIREANRLLLDILVETCSYSLAPTRIITQHVHTNSTRHSLFDPQLLARDNGCSRGQVFTTHPGGCWLL